MHNVPLGYILWIFGVSGAHRFYYGKPITGTLWFCTFGLLTLGWLVDLFLIPGMEQKAKRTYVSGHFDYNVSWLLLTFFGWLGLHRFYMGKWVTGLLYLCTGGLFLMGILYDFWTLNGQIDSLNRKSPVPQAPH